MLGKNQHYLPIWYPAKASNDESTVDNTTTTEATTKKSQRKHPATPVDFRTEYNPVSAHGKSLLLKLSCLTLHNFKTCSDVSTGPDPFPFRAPRQDRVNQLVEYYNKYLNSSGNRLLLYFSL